MCQCTWELPCMLPREDVRSLGRNDLVNCASDLMHDGLKSKVLIGCEVTNNVFDMAPRHHKCVTPEGGTAAEKRHVDTIVVEQLMLPARLAGQEAAYEAAANRRAARRQRRQRGFARS